MLIYLSDYLTTSVKLTKKGDSLSGSINRSKNYISRHGNDHIDLVLLAGTNYLANRKTSPEELIEKLDKQITELKGFNNLGHIFLCKIPHRFDFHVVNSKVIKFNELLHERFSDTEEFCHCYQYYTTRVQILLRRWLAF